MDLNELTPERFEKAEFTERRRGYDIDQVETFLEETGTAVAQLLVRHRQLEERASSAEARLADAEARLAQQPAEVAAPRASTESDEIERATSTLVMAKRTADATIAEAEAEAARMRNEAAVRADSIVAEAHRSADEELHQARRRTTEVVTTLEARRDAVASVVEGFERRIEDYRSQLGEAADALRSIVDDPSLLAGREPVPVPESAMGYTPAAESVEPVAHTERDELDLTDSTQVHHTSAASLDGSEYAGAPADPLDAPQSVESRSPSLEAQVRESAVVVDAEPVTGQTSDRFLRELDEAVNESTATEGDQDAISAFFDGEQPENGRSRFGWRR
jgi:cell division septum initiation protein DivIVA